MGVGPEATPKGVGKFLLGVFGILIALLVIFAFIFYSQGHKSGVMRNSQNIIQSAERLA
jgi:hypothetical protein